MSKMNQPGAPLMNPMQEIITAAKRGDWEQTPDGRVFVFTNKEIREGYMLEKDEFTIKMAIRPEYLPGSGNKYQAAITRHSK